MCTCEDVTHQPICLNFPKPGNALWNACVDLLGRPVKTGEFLLPFHNPLLSLAGSCFLARDVGGWCSVGGCSMGGCSV